MKKQDSLILFRVGTEEFAIELLEAKEIITSGQIRKLPKSYDFIEGIFNYRGDIIFIVSLKKKLKLDEYKVYKTSEITVDEVTEIDKKYFLIVNLNGKDTGFLVDDVINISHVNEAQVEDLSQIFQTNVDMDYIKGIVKFKDRPRILLDLKNILTQIEQEAMEQEFMN